MNKKNVVIFSSIVVLILILIAIIIFSSNDEPIPEVVNYTSVNYTQIVSRNVNDAIGANNQFGLDMYSLVRVNQGNIFFSPYSITSALTMTYEGARRKTQEEIKAVLHLPADIDKIRADYKKEYDSLNKENKLYKISVANALWAQESYPFSTEYFDIVKDYYYGNAQNLDFISDTENSRVTINNWVEEKTNYKILNLIPEGLITKETRLVLTNAIYFNANWSDQFDKEATDKKEFSLYPKGKVNVDMMHKNSYYNYAEDNITQFIEIPYIGDDMSMLVFLPKTNIIELENTFDYDHIDSLKGNMTSRKVELSLPKFTFVDKFFLSEELKKMGMPIAFDPENADFSGMLSEKSKENLFIGEVIHQAFINLSESGTEAAAATAVVMVQSTGIPSQEEPIVFNADHPFLFVIQQKSNGNILFIGRMSNPKE